MSAPSSEPGPAADAGAGPTPAATAAKVRRVFCATILVCEALVVVFALLVAKDLSHVSTGVLVGVGGGIALACLLLSGLLRRPWAYVAGTVLQVAVLLLGFVVPAMFLLGVIFAGLWFVSLVLARRVETVQAGFLR